MTKRPPVIIIGMHRSGTTMVTRILEKVGLFVGWRKDPNHESLLFLQLNEWLMRQAGATWDDPEPIRRLLGTETLRNQATRVLRDTLGGWPSLGYLGPLKFARKRAPFALTDAWGWKDPRNTLTYPVWVDLFPGAKILHVTRHGVDVANSLVQRESRLSGTGHLSRISFLGVIGEPEIPPSRRCEALGDAFALWEQYLAIAAKYQATCDAELHQIRFEDFLASPVSHLEELAAFCGLHVTASTIEKACNGLETERAFAYRENPALIDFAASMSDRLGEFNY
ncbi:MAG: sulfotransferase [Rhodospirillales bacterium]|nr:MAG: sulfotransferase [Rhodospirillales bacterium]